MRLCRISSSFPSWTEKDTSLCEEEVELDALVQEACERLQPAAERKRVTLSAETEPILFRGVKQVLSEMIYNLCDNAIRYNKEGGAVFVTLKQKADRISLTVRDTGIGIAKEEQGRIFREILPCGRKPLCGKRRHRLRAFYCQTWCGTA